MNLKHPVHASTSGIALIIVMITVLVLSVLAGGFAYSMRVETKLARNAASESQLLWLGRSGVELARYVLGEQLALGCEPYDALNQIWAGGPGGLCTSNSPLAGVQLTDVALGNGRFSIRIVDLERKFNLNVADELILQQAFIIMGVDPGEFPALVSAILDWIDADDDIHLSGAESDYYQTLHPPYRAKNGPMEDLSELLLVRGITPELYWGPTATNAVSGGYLNRAMSLGSAHSILTPPVGLVDLFTTVSSGKLNINTASISALQLVPFLDEGRAARIVALRAGYDGIEGTEDDTPAGTPGLSLLDMLVSAGLTPAEATAAARYLDQRSRTFEVTVEAQVNGVHRTFVAILGRNSPRDVQILSFYWK
ncbi:MAG: type II secretion system protein GspK [Verrucomicrobiota bacterium]|nr:type II secretion system protein GspK [Limisphaera sp.]MDW8381779.1 type II secretion system protein GspK [Verrucomicrobiota bacterium]